MALFPKPPGESLAPAHDRWTPLYLEHGRVEVDDSSVKWVGADGLVCALPVATLSALLLGPGTTITQAAVRSCAQSACPICWVGAEGLKFYAYGLGVNATNDNARAQATVWASRTGKAAVARKMFALRFGEPIPDGRSIAELRGMEGLRVRTRYAELGLQYGVTWKGRDYDKSDWQLADGINRALSAANASLYALCNGVICSMGYLPQLGFVHASGDMPFACDIADMIKAETSFPAAFEAVSLQPADKDLEDLARALLKRRLEDLKLLPKLPKLLKELIPDDRDRGE